VGKSRLGIEVARVIGGEIVNADSLQVYKYLDIGTAKPKEADREGVPHHLVDIVNPDEEYNAGIYTKTARLLIGELHGKSAKIIVVGGTYLYVRVLLHGIVEKIPADREIRHHLRRLKSVFGTVYLYEKLKSLDPDSAYRIHRNDYVRVERALEAYYLTGEKMSQLQEKHGFKENEYDVLKIGISQEREVLRKRIDERVDKMMEEGLLDEVRKLRRMGFGRDLKPMQSIGYKQMNQYLDGEITLERAIELIKRDTKRLAKRQMTWLRQDKDIHWHQLPEDRDKLMDEVETFYRVKS
jgi:tRNA dimethylallyltransferase